MNQTITSINGTTENINDVSANIELALRTIEANDSLTTFEEIASLCASFVMSDFVGVKRRWRQEEHAKDKWKQRALKMCS